MIFILSLVDATVVYFSDVGEIQLIKTSLHTIDQGSVVYLILPQIRFYDQQKQLSWLENNNGECDMNNNVDNNVDWSNASVFTMTYIYDLSYDSNVPAMTTAVTTITANYGTNNNTSSFDNHNNDDNDFDLYFDTVFDTRSFDCTGCNDFDFYFDAVFDARSPIPYDNDKNSFSRIMLVIQHAPLIYNNPSSFNNDDNNNEDYFG